jgi:hypothetical protein
VSTRILDRSDQLVAILADLGDYLRDADREPGSDVDRRTLEGFTADALLAAEELRRDATPVAWPAV